MENNRSCWCYSESALTYSKTVALGLRFLGTVLGTPLHSVAYSGGIKCSTNSVISNTRQVFYPPTPDQDNRVLLQVVALTADVRGYLESIGQPDPADFTQRRVRLFWCGRVYTCTNTPFLWACLQRRHVTLDDFALSWLSNQLVDSGHNSVFSCNFSKLSAWAVSARSAF
jgi:hypothetical protein